MNESDIKLSKSLSYFLRHAAGCSAGDGRSVPVDSEGFASVDSILALPQMRHYTLEDVERAVRTNDKQRFALVNRSGDEAGGSSWYIRANQGHTFKVPDLALKPITIDQASSNYGQVVHASFARNWPLIKEMGLSRMSREHIHFLPRLPTSQERRKISGKLRNADLFIYIDMHKAIQDGYQFYLSDNNVVLCPGDEHGVLDRKYFVKVLSGRDDNQMSELSL